jgi:hypothetical protein
MSIKNLKSTRVFTRGSAFRRAAAAFSVALALASLSLPSSATTLVYKSFDDLMKEADAVVAGHVVSVDSQYNANREIYTFVTLDQVEVLSGNYTDSTLTIRLKGGKVQNDISHVIGSPEFTEGERVILFVNGNGRYMVPLVGWTQGVFRIQQDPATSLDVVKDADGNRVVGVQNGHVLRDLVVPSEATILRQLSGVVAAQSRSEGAAGSSDSKSSEPVTTQVQRTVVKVAPTLTAEAFRGLIRQSVALQQSKTALASVRLMDFSVPNANVDVTNEGKAGTPNTAAEPAGAPELPRRSDLAPVKDQQ